jgi:choline dehydrogenase-like flavoprotein
VEGARSKRFLRGFGYQGGGNTDYHWSAPGFGESFKAALRDSIVSVRLTGFGECLPYADNFVEIDPETVDTFGIPVLRIQVTWRENELAMIPDMAESAAEMLDAAGAKNIRPFMVPDRVPGYGIHEMGGARMGIDPKQSVLNAFQQTHDVSNLFVMDASGFPSGGCQNPTLTIMALALRSTDHLMEEMKRGNL